MEIYNGIFSWDGWGGALRLASGKCHLKLYDLNRGSKGRVTPLKTTIAIVSDLPGAKESGQWVSVRACSAHVATQVVKKFRLKPKRLLWIEYKKESIYGAKGEKTIPESHESVEFSWRDNAAFEPVWRPLAKEMIALVKELENGLPQHILDLE